MAVVVVGDAVITADRRKDERTVVRVADALALHGHALYVGLTAIQKRAAIHATDRLVDARAAARRARTEAGDLDSRLCRVALIDIGVAVDATDRVEGFTAIRIAGPAHSLAGNLDAGYCGDTGVTVGLSVDAADRLVLFRADQLTRLRERRATGQKKK